jgi:hypothetical protein
MMAVKTQGLFFRTIFRKKWWGSAVKKLAERNLALDFIPLIKL